MSQIRSSDKNSDVAIIYNNKTGFLTLKNRKKDSARKKKLVINSTSDTSPPIGYVSQENMADDENDQETSAEVVADKILQDEHYRSMEKSNSKGTLQN